MGCRDLPIALPLHPCNFNPPCRFAQKTSSAAKQKNNPLEEKPCNTSLADGAGHCSAPGSRYPTAATASPRHPARPFRDIPVCFFQLCTWSRTCRWPLMPLPPDTGSCRVFCFRRSPPGPFLFPSVWMWPEEISAPWLSSGQVPAAVAGWGRRCGSLCPRTYPPWQWCWWWWCW